MRRSAAALSLDDGDKPEYSSNSRVISIEKSEAPGGAAGDNWYRYVIDSPGAPLTGYFRGKKSEVKVHVDNFVSKLDERRNQRKSPYSYTSGGKSKPAKK